MGEATLFNATEPWKKKTAPKEITPGTTLMSLSTTGALSPKSSLTSKALTEPRLSVDAKIPRPLAAMVAPPQRRQLYAKKSARRPHRHPLAHHQTGRNGFHDTTSTTNVENAQNTCINATNRNRRNHRSRSRSLYRHSIAPHEKNQQPRTSEEKNLSES